MILLIKGIVNAFLRVNIILGVWYGGKKRFAAPLQR